MEDRRLLSLFTVNSTADTGTGSGLVGDLRYCITHANSTAGANTITFDSTVFATQKTIILNGTQLPALSDTTGIQMITGPAAGVTISGNHASRVFQVNASVTASISGLTITGGSTTSAGGGLDNLGAVTLTNVTLSGNSGGNGGGLYSKGTATATLTNCTVSGNSATLRGGGVADYKTGGTIALTNCTVSGNSAGIGGGFFSQGTATLTDVTLSGNSTTSTGGGVYNIGTATLTNVTLSGNSASTRGGGLWSNSTVTLNDCTVSGNSATTLGGGVFRFAGTATLSNTIVALNTVGGGANDISGTVSGTFNLIGTGGSGGLVNGTSGNIVGVANPGLASLGNFGGPTQTMALLPGSPAIDAGSISLIPNGVTTDQRGDSRIVNSTVDIGAFESSGFAIAVTSGSGQTTNVNTAFSAPLVATVTANNASEPVAGGLVTFTAPGSGASATLSGSPATLSATGTATVTASANSIAGSYSVSATATGITSPASFSLTNLAVSLVVNNPTDAPVAGETDLRQAITLANTLTGPNTITFDPTVFATPQTIILNGTQLPALSDTTGTETITGPAAGVTISGGGLSRVFQVNASATASISGLTITGGSTTGAGGGLDNLGTITLTNVTLSGNTASTLGGGLYNIGTATLTNVTLCGNSAGTSGGGLWSSGTVTSNDSTVSGNSATTAGGGVFRSAGTATLSNTIVAGNNSDISGTVSGNNNLIGTGGSGGLVNGTNGNIVGVVNPGLASLGNYGGPTQTMALLPGSPAIDAGSNSRIPTGVTTDQRGDSRIVNSTVDIGAFESSGFTIAVTSGSGQTTNAYTAFSAPLVATVTANNASEPVAGGLVTFTAPGSGASATLSGSPATLSATGPATVTAAANIIAGNYTVSATATGITSPASFSLTNLPVSLVVNNPTDTPVVGETDLRQAITLANMLTGPNTITFDPTVFATPQTITLNGTQLSLTNTTGTETITGPAAGVTISGNDVSRVFQVNASVTASISGLTISGGTVTGVGGGLYNLGTITLTNVTLSGNSASQDGGGLDNVSGTVTLTNCTVSGNTAGLRGGGVSTAPCRNNLSPAVRTIVVWTTRLLTTGGSGGG